MKEITKSGQRRASKLLKKVIYEVEPEAEWIRTLVREIEIEGESYGKSRGIKSTS